MALAATQVIPASPTETSPVTCATLVPEIVTGETRIRELQAELQSSANASVQNAQNQQAVARGATALGWATGIASLVPGVGFAASAAGAAATQQAIVAGQRATAATNQMTRDVVSELVPLSQRMHSLRQSAEVQGCALPPPPPQ